jgi:HK97 family phage portal protein
MGIKDKILRVIFAKAFRLFPVLYQEHEATLGVEGDADAEAYVKTYSAASWVYICVRKIAQTCAMMAEELKFYKKTGDEIEEVKQGEVVELFDQVNPFISKTELIESVVSHRLLNGNAYWAIEGNGKKELYPLRPDRIKIIPDAKDFIKAFDYYINGKTIRFDADEIIHFKYFNAENDYYGLSPLAVARMILTLDFHALTWNNSFFKNSTRPDGFFVNEGNLSDAAFERMQKQLKQKYGGSEKAHKTWLLEGGIKYQAVGLSPKDVEFLNLRKMNREEICAIFGVPPGEVGILEYSNYANLKEQRQIFWEDVVVPELKAIANTLNEKFIRVFDPKLFCRFNLSNVMALKEDEEKKMTVARGLVTANIQTINEVRKDMYNKEPLEWGDLPVQQIPMSFSLGGSAKAIDGIIHAKAISLKAISYTLAEKTHWKKFDATLTNYENRFKRNLVDFLDEQKQRIIKNVNEFLNTNYLSLSIKILSEGMNLKFTETEMDQIFDMLKENGLLGDMSKAEFVQIITEIGKETALGLGVDFNYFPLTPQIESWLQMKIQRYVQSVNENIRQEVADIIIRGLDDGLGTHEISGNIADHLGQTKDYRSDRIARTELLGVSNMAQWEAYSQSGVVKKKRWIGTLDDRIRDTHEQAHYQYENGISLDQMFNVGGSLLMFPGDVGGEPEEVVNCRCTIMPITEDLKKHFR